MKKIFSIAILMIFATGLMGCNTVAGIGKDVQKVGEKVEGAAKK
ncbi:MAG: Entericidin EcnA/B family [Pseudomonadota bacterium]|jgi:predicted small secreted protein